ncbi:AAA family ATPase [Campylobacter sp. faydin G-140]|uniref:AAA family ATPase n=1 Tax=Campylobacter anatolicus TaxID=2829105 RepID=UPI001B9B3BB5|nr:AAA family ATPase [Campylobacter anatolicus]MBR8466358.1 AAA family ATPase [Campylobacter anatolicus]
MKEIIDKLNEFLKESKISASALARAIGVSSAAISQFRQGVYKGDTKSVAIKVEKYINNYQIKSETKSTVLKDEIFASKDAKMAKFVINEAINEREIALVYGSAGTGKTTILKEFAKNSPNAVLIEATCHTTAKVLLEELCEALKIDGANSINAKLKAVARFLKDNDKIILIDEAEHLPLRALEDLRRIYDFSRTTMILCGTEILLNNLMGKNKELRQLYSRICGKWCMQGLSEAECESFYGSGIYEYSKGNFRSSAKLYKKALRLAQLNECELDNEIIANATQMVILG